MWHLGLWLKWKKLQFGPASWKGHDFIPSMPFLSSLSGGGGEAEPQCGPPRHLSRRPHWLPGGSVATAEHLHGPSVSPVHQRCVWGRQQSGWSPLSFSFHFLYSYEQKNPITFTKWSAQVHLRAWVVCVCVCAFNSIFIVVVLISFICIHGRAILPSVHPLMHLFVSELHVCVWLA